MSSSRDGRGDGVPFSVGVRTTCEDALSGGEAISHVSLCLEDGIRFDDVEVEAIRGDVIFIRTGDDDFREVCADAVVQMSIPTITRNESSAQSSPNT